MYILLVIIHVVVCLFLIVVVLLQSGKAADLAGAFGGMGSQTVFGPRGSATVLSKATTISAILFMFTSMTLSIMATRGGGGTTPDLLRKAAQPGAAKQVPALPTPPPQATPSSIPITVTPEVGGKKGAPQTVQAPVVPAPSPNDKK
jgi:preprotein translocase subunit SecG